MAVTYDRRSGKLVDSESGMMVGLYGWADDDGTSFGFHAPRSDATSYRDEPWFRFSAYPFFEASPPETPLAPRKVVGYRVPALRHLLFKYHKGDMEKLHDAQRLIVAALSTYLTEMDGIANPQIEMD